MTKDKRRSPVDGHWYSWADELRPAEERTLAARIRQFILSHFTMDEIEYQNSTHLAEDVADLMEHNEWLDDETHVLWDVCVDIFQFLDITEA